MYRTSYRHISTTQLHSLCKPIPIIQETEKLSISQNLQNLLQNNALDITSLPLLDTSLPASPKNYIHILIMVCLVTQRCISYCNTKLCVLCRIVLYVMDNVLYLIIHSNSASSLQLIIYISPFCKIQDFCFER